MISHTLIGPQRCDCGAVSFHVVTCPVCHDRIDRQGPRKPAFVEFQDGVLRSRVEVRKRGRAWVEKP